MFTLAIDTTGEWGGAALYRGERCLESIAAKGMANYSIILFEAVHALLTRQNLELPLVDLFAVANGPGSFTGIRVGLAAAQAWAMATGRPVRGVNMLDALVEMVQPSTPWAVSLLDARRGEFYARLYHRAQSATGPDAGAGFRHSGEGTALHPTQVAPFLAANVTDGEAVTLITRQHEAVASRLVPMLPSTNSWIVVEGPLFNAIVRLAQRAQASTLGPDPEELNACYIRRPDAELDWK